MKHIQTFEGFLNEGQGIWPKSKLGPSFDFILQAELKKKFKGIFYVEGYDLYHNNVKVLTLDDVDSVYTVIDKLSKLI